MESQTLTGSAITDVFRQCYVQNPVGWECVRELCRRLCIHFGVASIAQPVLDLGTALSRGQIMSWGFPFDGLSVTIHNSMTPPAHRKGLKSFVDEDYGTWKIIIKECKISHEILSEFLWDESWQDTFPVDDAAAIHGAITDALLLIEDVKIFLEKLYHDMRICLEPEPKLFPSPMSLVVSFEIIINTFM